MQAPTRHQHHAGRRCTSVLLGLGLTAAALTTGVAGAPGAIAAPVPPGEVVGWGAADRGASDVPSGLGDVTAVSAGVYHSIALLDDGTVAVWGDNEHRQQDVPAGLSDVTAVSAGLYHNVALKTDGTVVAWGFNNLGQIEVPAGLSDVTAIAGGFYHTIALKEDGSVVVWGTNLHGQQDVPAGLDDVTAIAAGTFHNLALKEDGTVAAWGDHSGPSTEVPAGLDDVTALAGGFSHSLALQGDGTVAAWGEIRSDPADVPAGLSNVSAISAGLHHNLALRDDGTALAWGDTAGGQLDVPAGLRDATAVAAGSTHGLAILTPPSPGTVAARSLRLPYGKAMPARAYTVTGLRDGDTLTTPPTCTVAGALQRVRTFSHTCTGGDAGPDYDLTHVAGTVTVTKAATTVQMQQLGRTMATPRATLVRRHDDQRLANRMIRFKTNGRLVCRDRTDSHGVATCGQRVKVTRNLVAVYPGAPRYRGNRGTTPAA